MRPHIPITLVLMWKFHITFTYMQACLDGILKTVAHLQILSLSSFNHPNIIYYFTLLYYIPIEFHFFFGVRCCYLVDVHIKIFGDKAYFCLTSLPILIGF
jgi:hypothetical protein